MRSGTDFPYRLESLTVKSHVYYCAVNEGDNYAT